MARYMKIVDIWAMLPSEIAKLQPGQWVSAGPPEPTNINCGRFYGVKQSGSIVVAWNGNARQREWKRYQRSLLDYANSWS